ncbi:MAG: hypothetical protein LBS20_09665 [Prevotella sp.]|jgi:hypothetical protein|nr:hypothetical protein [Prevotella sp.]
MQTSERKYHFGKEKINITNNNDWIIVNHFKEQSYYTISVLQNENDGPRKGTLILKGKDRIRVIDIFQEGQDITSKFECEEFRKALRIGYISNSQLIRVRDVQNIKELEIEPFLIKSFAGLEYFYDLEIFIDRGYSKKSEPTLTIDFSKNKKLKSIRIPYRGLQKIIVDGCSELEEIYCSPTRLDTLDISKNRKLRKLHVRDYPRKDYEGLRAIILPSLGQETPLLEEFYCHGANVSDLDLYKCPNLKKIDCSFSSIINLDLRECLLLEKLICSNNKIKYLDLRDCISLDTLVCNDANIEKIRFGDNQRLKSIDCNNNKITTLNVVTLNNLEYLDCSYNRLTSLDVSGNTRLKELYCRKQISKWTISEGGRAGSLKELILPDNRNQNTGLTILKLDNNKVEKIDLSKNPYLVQLDCNFNKLQNLDLSYNPNMEIVKCGYNYIRKLDFSQNKELKEINSASQGYAWIRIDGKEYNLLAELCLPDQSDIPQGKRLQKLEIRESNLKTPIDFRNIPDLEYLDYSDSGLTTLDVSHNQNLKELVCYSNNIKTLDLTKNPELIHLNISWNKIKEIDLSKNTKLKIVTCVDRYKNRTIKHMTIYLSKDMPKYTIEFADVGRDYGIIKNTKTFKAKSYPIPDYIRAKYK